MGFVLEAAVASELPAAHSRCPTCDGRLRWAGMSYVPHQAARCARRLHLARQRLLRLLRLRHFVAGVKAEVASRRWVVG